MRGLSGVDGMVTPSSSRLPIAIENRFPNLWDQNYRVTSDKDKRYNCIAWTVGVINLRFWPSVQDYRWPTDISQQETAEAFVQFYARSGYQVCDSPDLEGGYEKIAIYCDDKGTPQHAARQLPSGQWTSKLGELHDIIHNDMRGVEIGFGYGRATIFMRRPRAT